VADPEDHARGRGSGGCAPSGDAGDRAPCWGVWAGAKLPEAL